jgi:hypothetical protein
VGRYSFRCRELSSPISMPVYPDAPNLSPYQLGAVRADRQQAIQDLRGRPPGVCWLGLARLTAGGVDFCNRRRAAIWPGPPRRLLRFPESATETLNYRNGRREQQSVERHVGHLLLVRAGMRRTGARALGCGRTEKSTAARSRRDPDECFLGERSSGLPLAVSPELWLGPGAWIHVSGLCT